MFDEGLSSIGGHLSRLGISMLGLSIVKNLICNYQVFDGLVVYSLLYFSLDIVSPRVDRDNL